MNTCTTTSIAAVAANHNPSPMEKLDVSLLSEIVAYIGPDQYRFVAIINQNFRTAYRNAFQDDREDTCMTAITLEHARICFEEGLARNYDADSCMKQYYETKLCSSAAKYGNLPALQYLRSVECPWNENVCTFAATNGDLNMLQWAHDHGCQWNENVCTYAATNGDLNMLQYAHLNGCPWNAATCSNAAKNGHLNVLQWARENGCPWNESTCSNAVIQGHLNVLQWARANGCPWDYQTCSNAVFYGHLHVLQWARENGCPWNLSNIAAITRRNMTPEIIEILLWIDPKKEFFHHVEDW